MLALRDYEKWVRPHDMICLADLALRWPYWAIFKILIHTGHRELGYKHPQALRVFLWKDEAVDDKGQSFHLINKIGPWQSGKALINRIPSIFFLLEDIEIVENHHPEYRASKPLEKTENSLLLANEENLPQIVSCIITGWGNKANEDYEGIMAELYSMGNVNSWPVVLVDKILAGHDRIEPGKEIRPTFMKNFNQRKNLTTMELAKEFVLLCNPKNHHEECLVTIEIDKRFSGIPAKALAELFAEQGDIAVESMEKRGKRLRDDAYKFKKKKFDYYEI